ncbi:hypothetical protein NIES2100_70820 [Calothrix sp. NIES-2100]|uniref:hypothetical protein n=1 Tax=Calothrix sp. NIES-2100 TaxID=1954172 RepID=UPI000B5FE376|nr:hypothetical protein NIES2100_70820 [Calothrix sp. NIES-2100]
MFSQNNIIKPEFFSVAELFQKQKQERQERLHNGVREGDFYVYFRRDNLTIQIECNGSHYYEIDLEQCNNSIDLLDWIFQIHSKTWAESSSLLDLILTVVDDACYAVHGKDIRTLFLSSKTLDWNNPNFVNE